jgi:glycerol kinase
MAKYILSIDQGTSATKVIIINEQAKVVAIGTAILKTQYLPNGFVEQDAFDIYNNVITAIKKAVKIFLQKGFNINDIISIGISNQRETFVIWDNKGKPLYNAIVWQCKRSTNICKNLNLNKTLAKSVNKKTGLFIDPYFSATKLIWLYQNNKKIKRSIDNNEAYFGTIDTWLLYQLTNGKSYCTDHTNASRTLLFNLKTLTWDKSLCKLFSLEKINLPIIQPSSSYFGKSNCKGIFKSEIPITAMIGDSQAAAFGEKCFLPGAAKATLGTGCSILMNIGTQPKISKNGMVTTVCYSINQQVVYAYEGVIVSCGATIEWLKKELKLFVNSTLTETMALKVINNDGVFLIPAFSGLGSPYWQMDRKATIHGLTFGTSKNHIVRAALESICFQIKASIQAMENDAQLNLKAISLNGGISKNQFVVQYLANLLGKKIVKSNMHDVSALGAGLLSGLSIGIFKSLKQISSIVQTNQTVLPSKNNQEQLLAYKEWCRIIQLKY